MLIGLSAKNAILIVEFAEQLRRKGRSIAEAAIEAAELRLRPILMTSFAFILGVMPLVFCHRRGCIGPPLGRHNHRWGHAVFYRAQPRLYTGALCPTQPAAQAG